MTLAASAAAPLTSNTGLEEKSITIAETKQALFRKNKGSPLLDSTISGQTLRALHLRRILDSKDELAFFLALATATTAFQRFSNHKGQAESEPTTEAQRKENEEARFKDYKLKAKIDILPLNIAYRIQSALSEKFRMHSIREIASFKEWKNPATGRKRLNFSTSADYVIVSKPEHSTWTLATGFFDYTFKARYDLIDLSNHTVITSFPCKYVQNSTNPEFKFTE